MPFTGSRLLICTGDGKGKTTAALGMVLRCLGHGQRVSLIQFLKRDDACGEHRALAGFPLVTVVVGGLGFVPQPTAPGFARHQAKAEETLGRAAAVVASGTEALVVLDEVLGAIAAGLIREEALLAILSRTASGTAVVLTGRGATPGLMALADTVTEMREIKHGYTQGIAAMDGIER